MCNGSILDYMREDKGANFTFFDIVNIAAQIADGMRYLVFKIFTQNFCN